MFPSLLGDPISNTYTPLSKYDFNLFDTSPVIDLNKTYQSNQFVY